MLETKLLIANFQLTFTFSIPSTPSPLPAPKGMDKGKQCTKQLQDGVGVRSSCSSSECLRQQRRHREPPVAELRDERAGV